MVRASSMTISFDESLVDRRTLEIDFNRESFKGGEAEQMCVRRLRTPPPAVVVSFSEAMDKDFIMEIRGRTEPCGDRRHNDRERMYSKNLFSFPLQVVPISTETSE